MAWTDKDRKGDTGLADEYTFDIEDAYYGYTKYNEGKTPLLILTGTQTMPDGKVRENAQEWVSIGSFEPTEQNPEEDNPVPSDKGRFAVYVKEGKIDPAKRFFQGSKVRTWIERLQELGAPVEDKGENSLDSAMFVGLKVRCEREKVKTGQGEQEWMLPVEYLGETNNARPVTKTESTDVEGALSKLAEQCDEAVEFFDRVGKELGLEISDERVRAAWDKKKS